MSCSQTSTPSSRAYTAEQLDLQFIVAFTPACRVFIQLQTVKKKCASPAVTNRTDRTHLCTQSTCGRLNIHSRAKSASFLSLSLSHTQTHAVW